MMKIKSIKKALTGENLVFLSVLCATNIPAFKYFGKQHTLCPKTW